MNLINTNSHCCLDSTDSKKLLQNKGYVQNRVQMVSHNTLGLVHILYFVTAFIDCVQLLLAIGTIILAVVFAIIFAVISVLIHINFIENSTQDLAIRLL
ncbi:MAG: hypothetical protein K0R34_3468 [Herbinix sp.]|nr:hypothetical protein [Herbinix sp.]